MQSLITAISNLFNGNVELATVVVSFIPLIELKGGIVFAMGEKLSFITSYFLAYLGSTIAFIPVFFLLKPILNLLKKWKAFNGFANKIENYFQKKAEDTENKQKEANVKNKSATFLKQLGVFIFVAIPLPMTGVWTGTAIAVFLNLSFKEAVLPVVLGNLVAGLLVSGISIICMLIGIDLNIVLWALLGLAVIIFIITLLKVSKQNSKEDKNV